jgi:hypothetical protein
MSHADELPPVASWRKHSRHPASLLPSLRASILAGPDVQVVNVSRGGLLVEADVRLSPGSGVCLNVALGDQLYQVGGRICRVDAALANGKVKYRAGIALDEEMAIFDLSPDQASAAPRLADPVLLEQADSRERALRDTEAELASLRLQLEDERRQMEQQRKTLDTLTDTLKAAESYRAELLAAHAAEQGRWQEERRMLEERARHAEDLAADLAREARLARDSERRTLQQQDEQRSTFERELREYQQQLAELQTVHAALTSATAQRMDEYERERQAWSAREADVASKIETTESWCADQQDLLYQIRRQMTAMFTLLEGRGHLLAERAGAGLLSAGEPPHPPADLDVPRLGASPERTHADGDAHPADGQTLQGVLVEAAQERSPAPL